MSNAPVLVLSAYCVISSQQSLTHCADTTTKKEDGPRVQLDNIQAGKVTPPCRVSVHAANACLQTVADVIRTCLGPRAMLKMLMDPMGGIVMTSDGNAILREVRLRPAALETCPCFMPCQITVSHPAAKSLIEIARTQDEQVGDGTTSVVILGMHGTWCQSLDSHTASGRGSRRFQPVSGAAHAPHGDYWRVHQGAGRHAAVHVKHQRTHQHQQPRRNAPYHRILHWHQDHEQVVCRSSRVD